MKITSLKFTNLDSSAEIENYLEKKLSGLEKYLAHACPVRSRTQTQASATSNGVDTPHKLFVELAKTTEHHKSGKIFYAEADIVIPGGHLRATAESYDITDAIDILKEELQRQLNEYTEKKRAKDRKGRRESSE